MPSGSHSQTSLSLTAATVTEQTRPSTLFPRTRLRAQRPSDLQLAPSADLVTARSTTTDPDTAGPYVAALICEQRCRRGARRCSGCTAGLASGLRGLLRGAGCASRHGRTRTFPSPRARSLSQLYRRGMPLGGSASAGDGNENAAKREGRTPPALPREPHMEADSAACVDP